MLQHTPPLNSLIVNIKATECTPANKRKLLTIKYPLAEITQLAAF